MIAVIVKPFTVDNVFLAGGTIVDTEAWRNTERLLRGRHIRAASASELERFHEGRTAIARTSKARTSKPANRGSRQPATA